MANVDFLKSLAYIWTSSDSPVHLFLCKAEKFSCQVFEVSLFKRNNNLEGWHVPKTLNGIYFYLTYYISLPQSTKTPNRAKIRDIFRDGYNAENSEGKPYLN